MKLVDINVVNNKDKYVPKEYDYAFEYQDFGTFYEYWKDYRTCEFLLTRDEFSVVFERMTDRTYSTNQPLEERFADVTNILQKIGEKKVQNGCKTLTNMMFLGVSHVEEDEDELPKNIYKYFFNQTN